uniref:Uncharacterized LOC107748274 n=1 Tax=Sinocyclocheilus rhinocerous TaxID=307959 RepID=A0A673G5C6_9TELE
MAEEESELELDGFKKELETLLKTSASDERGLQSKTYCERFCELVVEQTGRWQVPLPQLQVLQSALCSFVHGAASFPPECEHVRYTLRSLALSIFELLLFFGKDEFIEHPLKGILDSFQDCYASLVRHQNVYLLQVRHIIKDGGPWANPVLEAIFKDSELPQEDVDKYLSSEVSIFFELRVRYLVACERLPEALALTRRCIGHSVVGRHLYFKQITLLFSFLKMADIDGKDAVEILCMMENEEKDETVLMLSKGFVSQKLQIGDLYYLWDLVFIWSRLYLRLNLSKQGFLEECKIMILSATNIKAIFPFMKVILAELGKDGLGFCVELCARALQTDLKNDTVTKSLIYKTIAYLLPNDLEVCRACALLVFFIERTVESYKNVFLLYNHPDQEYHADTSLVGNSVRFEALQILKKYLYFDPEFWSLLNIETNCLKLMSDKVAATLSESESATSSKIVHESTEMPVPSPRPDETSPEMHTAVDGLVPDFIPPSDASGQLSFNCSLCNKETKYPYILRHAMWHHRIDRKCMFCHKRYTRGRSPSVHFKVHIQELKKSNGLFNENICVKTEPEKIEVTKDKSKSKKKRKDKMLDSGLKKKKITPGDQKEDGEDVKRRKMTNSLEGSSENQEPKDNNAEFKEINPLGHKNGTQPKPKQPSTPFQGKRTGASTHVRCPVEICTFSAKSILVLSHVLSHHHGDKKALLFFFNFGKEKCIFCCRKLYNPQHFFDHVICHRGELKFPCYHYGCKERYQTRMELSEHMLGHHPLRASCCFPGCSMQVESNMLLYRHEKTHYRLDTNLEKKSFPKESEPTGHGVPRSLEDSMEAPPNSSVSQQILGTANLKGPASQDDDGKPLVLNKGSVNYSSKNHSLVNGHSECDKVVPPKPSDPVTKEQEPPVLGKPVTKQFIRPLPSAYLHESYISMPKRRKEPQVGSKLLGSVSKPEKLSTRQRCSRCFQSFNSEEELQTHKDKCTSLFGFDSDDESKYLFFFIVRLIFILFFLLLNTFVFVFNRCLLNLEKQASLLRKLLNAAVGNRRSYMCA